MTAVVLITPFAVLRSRVGKSSGPYTPIAGTAIPPSTTPASVSDHSVIPEEKNDASVSDTPSVVPTAAVMRRPYRSAMRPPTKTPMPIGVDVLTVKRLISVALKPRSSRRN